MGSVQARQICSYKKFRTIPRVERASISELLRGCLCEAGIRNSKRTQGGKLVTLHYYYYTIPQTTKPCHDMNVHHGWVRRYHYHHASASPPLLEARARDRAGGSQIHICRQRFLAFCGLPISGRSQEGSVEGACKPPSLPQTDACEAESATASD